MRLKTYVANNMSEAMRQVTRDLGSDAVIVSNRKTPEGMVKLTAALDTTMVDNAWDVELEQENKTSQTADTSPFEDDFEGEEDTQALIDEVTSTLLRHNVSAKVTDKILGHLEQSGQHNTLYALADALDNVFEFDGAPTKLTAKPLMVVGTPGSGKTLTVAKLAAHAVMAGNQPLVITTDTMRAGAMEQLNAFMRVLDLELHMAAHPDELLGCMVKHEGNGPILVDTAGVNPFVPDKMKELTAFIRKKDMDVVTVLAGGTDTEESAEIARAFKIIGAGKIIPTRLDMSRRIGGILAAADQAGLTFIGAGHSASVADGLLDLTALELARLLLPKKYSDGNRA